jgi:hypothetical protein
VGSMAHTCHERNNNFGQSYHDYNHLNHVILLF